MSDLEQLQIGLKQATVLDNEIDAENSMADDPAAAEQKVLPPLRNEIADMLNFMAMGGSVLLPTLAKHYNQDQNLKIADALIKLADRYGYDLREKLLGENSVILLWLGVAYTVGMPAGACFMDYKALKIQKASQQKADIQHETTRPIDDIDGQQNAVVTGV